MSEVQEQEQQQEEVRAQVAKLDPLNTSASMLIYGDSGAGKTTQLTIAALWVAKRYGKRSLYFGLDEGGHPDLMQELIDRGIVRICRLRTMDPSGKLKLAAGVMQYASLGYWPERVAKDGTVLSTKMISGTSSVWILLCPAGHEVQRGETKQELKPAKCPTCAVLVEHGNGRVREERRQIRHLEGVGAVFYDSITGGCDWCKDEQDAMAAAGLLGGGDGGRGGGKTTIISGPQGSAVTFGNSGWGGYGFVQARVRAWATAAATIPGLVIPPIWTARAMRVTPENQRPEVGPALIGQAQTKNAPAWYGNTLNAAVVEGEHRLYLREWVEPDGKDGTVHKCKVRTLPDTMPDYLSDKEGQRRFEGCSVATFFDMVIAARAAASAYVDEWGIPELEQVAGEEGERFTAPVTEGASKTAVKPAAATPGVRPTAPAAARPAQAPVASAAPKPPAPRPTVAGLPAPRAPIPVRK
jgi:energy-coupling factor transporter ATP-binding protein EcfA2